MFVEKVLALAIPVYILITCVYRRNIRSRRLFLAGIGLYLAGLALNDLAEFLQPSPFARTLGMAPPPTPVGVSIARFLSNVVIYASLPVFFAASWGSATAYAQCSNCGYDLTGNRSGTCSECGKKLTPDADA